MKISARVAALFAAVLALAACGGHASSTIPSTTEGQLVSVAFTIIIPPAITPQYISPSTQSATISVNSGTPAVANCSGGSCTTTVLAPVGSDTFAVSLYDAANGTGNVLSQGSATQTIVSGTANSVSVTLNGVPKNVTITSSGNAFTSVTLGSSSTIALTVTAKDAGGNTIIGTYSSPVQLTVRNVSAPNSITINGGTQVTISGANVTNVPSSTTVITASYSGSSSFTADRITAWAVYPTDNGGRGLASVLIKGPCTLAPGVGRDGYFPCDLQSAYNLTSISGSAGGTQTVAVVDAYDDPSAESDLQVYRTAFGLPACTSANGCFKKVSQTGSPTALPPTDPSLCASTTGCWEDEEALDIDMVSAICPNCHILLVEANTPTNHDLYAAEDEAVALGATEISNSFGGSEYSLETTDEVHFNHPGIPITASSGDNGFAGGTSYPASSRYVTAVGGTTLLAAANPRGWSESAWSSSGSGCSAFILKPAWQTDPGCAKRMVADVAADADTGTPVWIYTTYQNRGWAGFGGTSASAPMIAAVYAISGNASTINDSSFPYSHGSLYDVTSGNNGTCSSGVTAYFCTAGTGYDGPTGLGTPHGVSAFALPASVWIDAPPERTTLNYHPGPFKRVCGGPPQPGVARCFALERTDRD
ncbi:MAG TPA: hypothetical protein VFO29_04465 [Candidatus Rubrimentiphilum sp.]|nr:hypothetical protein [Candidatus Rubrimentiphilum sp.]